ncbi:MAG: hypothetical protein ACI83B_001267 [Sediminicola sp.]|jgi:hypothetical protein|uniref:hypothetical protein n=1 Tax=Nonlabens sp. TaxID=1888209 RepID=UPI0039E46725
MKQIKHFLSFVGMTFLLVSFSNCGGSRQDKTNSFEDKPPFTISQIFAQDWVAGVAEGGYGTNVHVICDKLNENLKIETIYFANNILVVRRAVNNPKAFVGSCKTVPGRDIIMDSDVVKEAQNRPKLSFPFELGRNEAVIKYSLEGKAMFFKVSDVLIKPKITYPTVNKD